MTFVKIKRILAMNNNSRLKGQWGFQIFDAGIFYRLKRYCLLNINYILSQIISLKLFKADFNFLLLTGE